MIDKNKTINEFMLMRDTAELKALSNLSLDKPLTEEQHKRIMELKKEIFK